MKVHQFSKKKPCYYCGKTTALGSLKEHVPPRLMFRPFDCDAISVPSCPEHNNDKSGRDRGVLIALVRSLQQGLGNDVRNSSLSPLVIQALEDLIRDYPQAVNEVQMRPLIKDGPEKYRIDLPYLSPEVNMKEWIRQLTAALVWSAVGKGEQPNIWSHSHAWSPLWIGMDIPQSLEFQEFAGKILQNKNVRQDLEKYNWKPGWSSGPRSYPAEIYRFSLAVLAPGEWPDIRVIFRHVLYDQTSWYTFFAPSDDTLAILQRVTK